MNIIKVDLSSAVVERDSGAEAEKQHLLDMASEITQVTNAAEQAVAVLRGRGIKSWLNAVEAARKAVKAPVRRVEARIDEIAETHSAELVAEMERLNFLVRVFQEKERKRVEEENRLREEEVRRAEAAKREADSKAAAAVEAVTEKEAGLTEAEQAIMAQEEAKAAQENFEVAVRTPIAEATRATGMTVRTDVVRFEVTDAKALYAVHPEWFELVPKRRIIGDSITKDTKLAGLKVWTETVTGFRG